MLMIVVDGRMDGCTVSPGHLPAKRFHNGLMVRCPDLVIRWQGPHHGVGYVAIVSPFRPLNHRPKIGVHSPAILPPAVQRVPRPRQENTEVVCQFGFLLKPLIVAEVENLSGALILDRGRGEIGGALDGGMSL